MKKLLIGAALILVAGICAFYAIHGWAYTQSVRAIEQATRCRMVCRGMDFDLISGRISLRASKLQRESGTGIVENVEVGNASGTLHWQEWFSGVVPLEIELHDCTVELEPFTAAIGLPKIPPDTKPAPDAGKSRVILTALKATNVCVFEKGSQEPLASGVNCSARNSLSGWQGSLTADKVAFGCIPITKIEADFINEERGIRLGKIVCAIGNGSISGSGLVVPGNIASLELSISGVELQSVAPSWCKGAFTGMLSGSLSYNGPALQWREGSVLGRFLLTDGVVQLGSGSQLLQMLGVSHEDAGLTLDKATGTLRMDHTKWELADLDLEKRDTLAINGNLSYGQDAKIKALLKVGVAAQLLSHLGGITSVTGDRNGAPLNWTELNVETSPQELLETVLAQLLRSQPDTQNEQKTENPKKSNSAIDAVVKFLTH